MDRVRATAARFRRRLFSDIRSFFPVAVGVVGLRDSLRGFGDRYRALFRRTFSLKTLQRHGSDHHRLPRDRTLPGEHVGTDADAGATRLLDRDHSAVTALA